MKNSYIVLLVCFTLFSFSQNQEINTTWQTEINDVFQRLEKHCVPNGILLNYGMHFTNLHAYDGNHIVDSNRVNILAFEGI